MMEMSRQDYLRALNSVLRVEGGPSNYGWDPGGETAFGIAKKIWPQYWEGGPPTREVATRFYFNEFWRSLGLDLLNNQALREEIFEAAVNCGTHNAIIFAQRAYNLLRPRHWTELIVDGEMGPKTQTSLNHLAAGYLDALLAGCNFYQAKYYESMREELRGHAVRGWFAKRLLWQKRS